MYVKTIRPNKDDGATFIRARPCRACIVKTWVFEGTRLIWGKIDGEDVTIPASAWEGIGKE